MSSSSRIHLLTSILLSFLSFTVIAVELVPISNPEHIYGPGSIVRRDEIPTGELDLLNVETFYWAAPAGNKMIYANFTVYFPEEYEHVISMERFADKLKSVQCEEKMVLEFIDDEAFEYAKDIWNWVNQDVNNTFVMVTNYEGCADSMERLPFLVSNIRYDEAANKAYLTADLKDWEDVARSYTLKISNIPLTPMHRMLMSRGILPRDTDFSMSLVSGFDANLFSKTIGSWTTSVDAVVRTVGSLNVDFDVDVNWRLKLTSASMAISPENVAASMQLALTEKGTLNQGFAWQDTILSIPIRGVEFLKKFKLGAFLDIDVGFTMDEWSGTAIANFGARMELSNNAILKVDLVNSDKSQFSGWAPTFKPIPPTLSAKVEGSARVFAEPNIKLEASAFSKGWSVSLNLQMPYIEADFGAMYDQTGVCDSKKTIGVDVDTRVGVQLTAQAATKGNEANPFWEKELYEHEWDLFSKCFPFGENNAKPGGSTDPKPPKSKSKKSKSKIPKPSKKPNPSPKPRSSKAPLTLKPTPKPKKPTPTPAKPSKAASSKTAKPTASNKASSEALPKPTPEASKTSSKLVKPTPDESDNASKVSSGPSSATKSSTKPNQEESNKSTGTPKPTSGDESAFASRSRSASVADKSDSAISSSRIVSVTLLSRTSSESFRNSASFGNSSAPTSGITRPPSTLATATLTTVSSSSSTPDLCPVNGKGKSCSQCGEDDHDPEIEAFFDNQQNGSNLPPLGTNRTARSLLRRFASGNIVFQCGTKINTNLRMATYPGLADRANPTVTVSDYYRAAESTDCLNHEITHTTAIPAWVTGMPDKPKYQAEHIYEANWIARFLRHLSDTSVFTCAEIDRIFFDTSVKTNNAAAATWAQALMESLASTVNQNDLVFLWADINGMKRLIFDTGDIIASNKWIAEEWTSKGKTTTLDADWRINKIATVGRAMDYMAQPAIGAKLLQTVDRVESTLDALSRSLAGPDLAKAGNLRLRHREWFNGFMAERNRFVVSRMQSWASDASESYTRTTPKEVAASDTSSAKEWTSTTSFLKALQTGSPGEWNAVKGVVGWYTW